MLVKKTKRPGSVGVLDSAIRHQCVAKQVITTRCARRVLSYVRIASPATFRSSLHVDTLKKFVGVLVCTAAIHTKLAIGMRGVCAQHQVVFWRKETRIECYLRHKLLVNHTRFIDWLDPKREGEITTIPQHVLRKEPDLCAIKLAVVVY